MRTIGEGAEQLTRDVHSNWFPHPSPDGRWVVFLTYIAYSEKSESRAGH